MKQEYNNLQFFDNEYFAEQAVRKDPYSLFFLPLQMKYNKKIVRIAVQQNGLMLEFAKNFSNDIEVVLDAVENNPEAINFASITLQLNRLVALAVIKKGGFYLRYLSSIFYDDEDIVLRSVSNYGAALKYATMRLKKNKKIVLAAVTNCGSALEYAAYDLKSDIDIAKTAINNDFCAIKFVSYILKNNIDFITEAININPLIVVMLGDELNNINNSMINYKAESKCIDLVYKSHYCCHFSNVLDRILISNKKNNSAYAPSYKVCSFKFK